MTTSYTMQAISGVSDLSDIRVALFINNELVHAPLGDLLQMFVADPLNLTSGQIKFPATQIPSADLNTLDDYEEGTWAPSLAFGGASTGITYGTRTGFYTKIGNLVFVEFAIVLTAKGSSTGAATVTALPFLPAGVATGVARVNAMASLTQNIVLESNSSTTINVRGAPSATAVSSLTDTNFTATSDLRGSLVYRA